MKKKAEELNRNSLKNREFDKEAHQNFCLERMTIAERQGMSEDKNFDAKPTQSKTNFSSCLGIDHLCIISLYLERIQASKNSALL